MSSQMTASRPATERSRAYPVLNLEEGSRAIGEILSRLGDGAFGREVLAEVLGYSNAHGGPGARKIAALAQYGLLRRRAGRYSPTPLARRIAEAGHAQERESALRRALRQPPLFRALIERYAPQGRVPAHLASVLWREHGITRKASRAAAETFLQSARYAGVLDRDGVLLPGEPAGPPPPERRPPERRPPERRRRQESPRQPAASAAAEGQQRFEVALTGGRVARLLLPLGLCREDLEIVRRQIDFLEYQVAKEKEQKS